MRVRNCFVGLILICALLRGVAPAATPGDVNCDGSVNEDDVIALVPELFADGDPAASDCSGQDVNADGSLDAADLTGVVRALLLPAVTPTPRTGPQIAFAGLAGADGSVISAVEPGASGVPVFQRPGGAGFQLVVEAMPGADGLPVGTVVFASQASDLNARPDLQVEASQALGDGNPGVCTAGGIRGFNPADFSDSAEVSAALNDFGCGFSVNTNSAKACTTDAFGSPTFVSSASGVVQFCMLVTGAKAFPLGETTLSIQVLDVGGHSGPLMRLIVRIGTQVVPTATSTGVPTAPPTRTFTPPNTTTRTATRTATPPTVPAASPSSTVTVALHSPTPTLSPSGPPSATRTASPTRIPTDTRTPVATPSVTPTVTGPPPPTATRTGTTTATLTATRTATRTGTPTASSTFTPSITGTRPPTATPTQTPTATNTRTASPSRTPTPSITGTQPATLTPTRTSTATRSPTATTSATNSPTATRTRTPSATPTTTRSATPTRTPTRTPTATPSLTVTRTPTVTTTPTDTRTPTLTRTPTQSPTPSSTPTVTWTPSITSTPTITLTPTITQTPTATVPLEPVITFFGVARADFTLVSSGGMTPEGLPIPAGLPIYERSSGANFYLVIEGRPGGAGTAVGKSTFNWDSSDSTALPDLQIWASRPLGANPSTEVCDDTPPFGGVPPLPSDPPQTQAAADAINDLACRFKDAGGARLGRGASDACTTFDDGGFHFVVINPAHPQLSSSIQFCGQINDPLTFPDNDTVVTARIRDEAGRLSLLARIVVRVTGP